MNNSIERLPNHVPELPIPLILKDIFLTPEIMKSRATVNKRFSSHAEGSSLIFIQAKNIVNTWGNKIEDWSGKYFRTKPVRIGVDNEQVDLIIHSGGRENIDILAKVIGVHENNIPVLFSVELRQPAKTKNGDDERATDQEITSALGVLSFMEESLSKVPQKTENNCDFVPSEEDVAKHLEREKTIYKEHKGKTL